jgi:hypothetical protein
MGVLRSGVATRDIILDEVNDPTASWEASEGGLLLSDLELKSCSWTPGQVKVRGQALFLTGDRYFLPAAPSSLH